MEHLASYRAELQIIGYSGNGIYGRLQAIKNCILFLNKTVKDITPADIRNYFMHLKLKGMHANTIQHYHHDIEQYFVWLEREKHIKENPFNRYELQLKKQQANQRHTQPAGNKATVCSSPDRKRKNDTALMLRMRAESRRTAKNEYQRHQYRQPNHNRTERQEQQKACHSFKQHTYQRYTAIFGRKKTNDRTKPRSITAERKRCKAQTIHRKKHTAPNDTKNRHP